MTSWIAPRSGGMQRHAFGFDRIVATPHHHLFRDWHARTGSVALRRGELDAMFSQPEATSDPAA
jgi:hypothetical protein